MIEIKNLKFNHQDQPSYILDDDVSFHVKRGE